MTNTTDDKSAITHSPEPWDCDGRTTMYTTPDASDEVHFIEVRANVTEAGWDTVAFVEAIWPGAEANARRIAAAVNACQGISSEALEQGTVTKGRLALDELLTKAGDLLAAIDGVTDQFDEECTTLETACTAARNVLETGTDVSIRELLAQRGQIALIWSVEDVLEERPDLTREQAWEVLEKVERYHNASFGVTWDTLKCVADDLFGSAPETNAA